MGIRNADTHTDTHIQKTQSLKLEIIMETVVTVPAVE